MEAKHRILEFVESLIREGQLVKSSKWYRKGNWLSGPPAYVDLQAFTKWRSSCQLLLSMLGSFGDTWQGALKNSEPNKYENALSLLGTLEAIRDNLKEDRLIRFAELVAAEIFTDLQSQAEYLLSQNYYIAAGVLFRGVLEEKLRHLAKEKGVVPEKTRSTIADFNANLYKAEVYDKIMMKNVEAMAAIGNDAAHVKDSLTRQDVERLGRDLFEFLVKYGSLSFVEDDCTSGPVKSISSSS